MKREKGPKPTNSELEILRVLWRRGPSTVAQVREELEDSDSTGYTTVLKLLQIMHEKGIVTRDEAFRPHIYSARFAEAETQTSLLQDFVQKAFGGSTSRMIVQALSTEKLTESEIEEIRKVVRQARTKKS